MGLVTQAKRAVLPALTGCTARLAAAGRLESTRQEAGLDPNLQMLHMAATTFFPVSGDYWGTRSAGLSAVP